MGDSSRRRAMGSHDSSSDGNAENCMQEGSAERKIEEKGETEIYCRDFLRGVRQPIFTGGRGRTSIIFLAAIVVRLAEIPRGEPR